MRLTRAALAVTAGALAPVLLLATPSFAAGATSPAATSSVAAAAAADAATDEVAAGDVAPAAKDGVASSRTGARAPAVTACPA
ncbi:hypothetical protein J0695_41155, partial [Streptomyces beijiangensis]|nr:hypothetical protein [Streptomyces beijiangensis]